MSSPKKKAHIAITMPRFSRYGGAESFAWRLSEALAARGHHVDFICGRCETDPPSGVTPIIVGRFGGLRFVKVLWFAIMAERIQRKKQYDFVFGMANTINQDVLRIGGGPISVFWQLSQKAWDEGFSRKFKMFRRRLSPVNWVIHWLDAIRMKRTKRIVAVSHFVRDLIVRAHPNVSRDAIDIIYNRPDLSRFSILMDRERKALRDKAAISSEQVVIGTAATNFALKGIRHLIHALTLLPENHVLHVAGGRNPDKYLRQARELGVAGRVRFLGKVEDMALFYNTVDVFVLASFYDACSNAVLEALACGCHVASSVTNGSAYFLPDECIFPDPSDVPVMAALIARLAASGRPDSFEWPSEMKSGIDPYIEMIEQAVSH